MHENPFHKAIGKALPFGGRLRGCAAAMSGGVHTAVIRRTWNETEHLLRVLLRSRPNWRVQYTRPGWYRRCLSPVAEEPGLLLVSFGEAFGLRSLFGRECSAETWPCGRGEVEISAPFRRGSAEAADGREVWCSQLGRRSLRCARWLSTFAGSDRGMVGFEAYLGAHTAADFPFTARNIPPGRLTRSK